MLRKKGGLRGFRGLYKQEEQRKTTKGGYKRVKLCLLGVRYRRKGK